MHHAALRSVRLLDRCTVVLDDFEPVEQVATRKFTTIAIRFTNIPAGRWKTGSRRSGATLMGPA
jgi:hypothetical protein